MKFKIGALSLLLFLVQYTFAESVASYPVAVSWQGIQPFSYDTIQENRLSFEQASYLDESKLPYYHFSMSVNDKNAASLYTPRLKEIVYQDCTPEEIALITSSGKSFTDSVAFQRYVSIEKRKPSLQIYFCPIVKQGDAYKKIVSAVLQLTSNRSLLKSILAGGTTLHQYASNSVLASGNWYKIRVATTGIYKLTYEDLLSMGITNPANVRIFGYGGAILPEDFSVERAADDLPEMAIFMEKGSDNVFGAGDYILFHAQGTIKWSYNYTTKVFEHEQNYYSNYGYYFVTSDAGTGKKIVQRVAETAIPADTVTDFLNYALQEQESVNLLESGREWYGQKFEGSNLSYTFSFSLPNIVTSKKMRVDIAALANSSSTSTYSVAVNNVVQSSKIVVSGIPNYYYVANKTLYNTSLYPTLTDGVSVSLTYQKSATSAYGYLDYIRVNAYQQLKMDADYLYFRNADVANCYKAIQYNVENTNSNTKIWEITDPLNISEIPTTYNEETMAFVAPIDSENIVRQFLAINTNVSYPKPEIVGQVANQNLHGISQADMVIIASSESYSDANRLAEYHRTHDAMSVLIVNPEQIYNEFSSGTPDATAYRWLMKMLYDRAGGNTGNMPKSLLLFGVSYYDNRGITKVSKPLLSYQSVNSFCSSVSYTTDDYYAFLDDEEGSDLSSDAMDIAVGRLPVSTVTEGTQVIDKIITYANNTNKGSWKNLFAFLADDENGNQFMAQSDALAASLQEKSLQYQPIKVYLDSYQAVQNASGISYPAARERILNLLKSGLLVFNYIGHGSTNSMTEEQTIVASDVVSVTNKNLPLWITATCDLSRYDDNKSSLGMKVLLNPYGGGIGLITTTRLVFEDKNYSLSKQIYKNIIPEDVENPLSIGEILRKSKVALGNDDNKLNFVLLGDPAMKLSYPKNNVVTTEINESVLPDTATISSLSLVVIKGYVENDAQTGTLSDFNGQINVVVYDKEETLKTLANKTDTAFVYKDRPNVIFSGKTQVVNGEFAITFMVPKDISYRYGTGRILYYAADTINNIEAHGYSENFLVGGSNDENIDTNADGPQVIMYLNTPHFESGQTVNSTPVFYAYMTDKYGINTVGAGIGHDIQLKLNDESEYTYVLNDYYEATLDDYKSGTIKYQLPKLAVGSYELQFKVWNLQNISTTKTLYFNVNDSIRPTIYSFYAYPNPASTETTLYFEYSRPDALMSATFMLFDVSGRMFWESKQTILTSDGVARVTWNLTDSSGNKVHPGVYLMSVKLKTPEGAYTTEVQKIIIIGQ